MLVEIKQPATPMLPASELAEEYRAMRARLEYLIARDPRGRFPMSDRALDGIQALEFRARLSDTIPASVVAKLRTEPL